MIVIKRVTPETAGVLKEIRLRALEDAVIDWNRARGKRELVLMVTSVNAGAIAFYETLGFVKTGVTSEYPNYPAIIEYEMLFVL